MIGRSGCSLSNPEERSQSVARVVLRTAIAIKSMASLEHRLSDRACDRVRSLRIVTLAALAIGVGAATSYYVQDLTLSHYDAKALPVLQTRWISCEERPLMWVFRVGAGKMEWTRGPNVRARGTHS
jgi:hypothetical protein